MTRTGLISETCSCGAEISAPATELGRRTVTEWRKDHRHDEPRPELKSLGRPVHSDESPATPAARFQAVDPDGREQILARAAEPDRLTLHERQASGQQWTTRRLLHDVVTEVQP